MNVGYLAFFVSATLQRKKAKKDKVWNKIDCPVNKVD